MKVNPQDVPEQRIDEEGENYEHLEHGMDLSFYNPSAEWDLMSLTSQRHVKIYPGCCGSDAYIDVSFNLVIRRKGLFYTVNLVVPCMLIAILTTFAFYIPPREHKMTYLMQTLVAITFFYLVLVELIPPSSVAVPLITKYLLLTLCLLVASIVISIYTVRVYRDASSNPVPKWMRVVYMETLPKYLLIKPPNQEIFLKAKGRPTDGSSKVASARSSRRLSSYFLQTYSGDVRLSQLAQLRGLHPDLIRRMIDNLSFISDQFRAFENDGRVSAEWAYVAVAMDRFWHILFTVINFLGALSLLLQSQTLYDSRLPLEIEPSSKPLIAEITWQRR
ncbi:unnamed protein product [Enterobius vermicularis]|uniref:Neur_chan_memb domain-containing protein n=1 Tax=Enterobius vermicularis TaxID=51028 RepID=A0A0N4VE21_ENTVE|nr:unnamed protein product [Enterobius vermicularis]